MQTNVHLNAREPESKEPTQPHRAVVLGEGLHLVGTSDVIKAPVIRGVIPVDGSPGRSDLSLGDQLGQRAAMEGERERADWPRSRR
jgi:hypothetical protein